MQAQGMQAQAAAEQQMMNYQARLQEMRGKQELANAQQRADEIRYQKKLAQSALQARSAGSGFLPGGFTEQSLGEGIESRAFRAAGGETQSGLWTQGMYNADAAARRYTGAAGVQAAKYQGRAMMVSSLFGGLGGMFKAFGSGPAGYGGGGMFYDDY
jgi:hypothetical protein